MSKNSAPITVLVPYFDGSHSEDHDVLAFQGHLDDAAVTEKLRNGEIWKPSDDPDFDLEVNVHEEGDWEDESAEFEVGDGVLAYKSTRLSYVILHTYLS